MFYPFIKYIFEKIDASFTRPDCARLKKCCYRTFSVNSKLVIPKLICIKSKNIHSIVGYIPKYNVQCIDRE